MRIALVEVGVEECIGEVLEARGVVRHDIGLAREVERGVVIAVRPLMLARSVAQVGGRAVGG